MESRSISIPDNRGFTLIESLVVIGIFILIMGVGGVIGFNAYKGYLFRSERSTAISVLERARSRAMANYYETAHGVKYDDSDPSSPKYILFRVPFVSGASSNEIIQSNPNADVAGFDTIIFEQLTGKVAVSGSSGSCNSGEKEIKITESDRSSSICLNAQGRINW